MPETIRTYAKVFPLTYVVQLLKGLWFGKLWSAHLTEVFVLVVMFTVGLTISAKTFRWD